MATLILTLDNKILCEYPLDKVLTTVGRRSTSDIHLDNLAVSGEHAAILQVGDDFYVEDVGSTNGTRVNAKLIKKHLLQHDDVIEFGKFQLKYLNEAVASGAVKGGAAVGLDNPLSTNLPAVEPKSKQSAAVTSLKAAINSTASSAISDAPIEAETLAVAKIKVLNGSNVGRELTLNKALTTLGKVGVQVAVITKRPHGYFITHVEGDVLPIVNGNSAGVQAFALTHHDVIELAGVKMEFYLEPPSFTDI